MTVHAAKGLEFRRVFVVRVSSSSFPSGDKESLVEFPAQLRNSTDALEPDPKLRHAQEERRLFYVAMTRAMDELYLCGKAGSDKRQPAPPTKYMRELVHAAAAMPGALTLRLLPPPPIARIHAAAEPLPTVSQWTQLPPRDDARLLELSASALQSYEFCPLKYKLRYDWKLPEDASAAPQFGNAMHLALKAYFDGVRAGRPPDEPTVVACFLDEFAKASIPEPLQREMYESTGRQQLHSFLNSELARPAGKILYTEKKFTLEIGGARVRGRLDRMDTLANGAVAVVDYKTGRPKTQDEADESLQLSIYALAARNLGHNPSALVFVNLENGVAIESQRSEKELRNAEALVQEIATKIAAGEFEPKPSNGCLRCSYRSICPAQEEPLLRPVERAVGVN